MTAPGSQHETALPPHRRHLRQQPQERGLRPGHLAQHVDSTPSLRGLVRSGRSRPDGSGVRPRSGAPLSSYLALRSVDPETGLKPATFCSGSI
jgi:hypothetical protein